MLVFQLRALLSYKNPSHPFVHSVWLSVKVGSIDLVKVLCVCVVITLP